VIIKGASRAGPKQLARHLARTDTNERVEVLELQSPTGSMMEAFRDWQMLADGTRGKLGLYHANIDPAQQYEMTREQWSRAVDVLEEELGLQGQPRAVVLHEKEGRQHIHVVWQRTDIDTMLLRHDGRNFDAHERASQRLEQEFGHEPVPGKHAKRDRDAQPEFPKSEITHAEWQQSERSGIDPRARKDQITGLYEASDTGPAFKAALADAGFVLAKGDRRDFVLIDAGGEVLSLPRQIAGVTAKDLRSFMADVPLGDLPTVAEARAIQRERGQGTQPDQEPAATDADAKLQERIKAVTAEIESRHAEQRAEQERRHGREIDDLQQAQQKSADQAFEAFAKEQARRAMADRPAEPGAFERLWQSIRETISDEARLQREAAEVRRAAEADKHREQAARILVSGLESQHRAELDALVARQGQERADLIREQADDKARRLADDERARQIEREYEQRRQDALSRNREGPERDDRAR
jgi:hypothetical protein